MENKKSKKENRVTPQVSVITATYNGAKTIKNAIQSVVNQTMQEWEMIIVDDCSTDNTVEIVREISKHESRIKIVSLKKNTGGPAIPRDTGIKEARGKYIAFLDQDDMYLPDNLKIKCNLLDENPKTDLIYGYSWTADLNSKKLIDYSHYLPLGWLARRSFIEKGEGFSAKQNAVDEIGVFFRYIKAQNSENGIYHHKEPCTLYFRHEDQNSEVKGKDPLVFLKRMKSLLEISDGLEIFRGYNSVLYSRVGNFYSLSGDLINGRRDFSKSLSLSFNFFSLILYLLSFLGPKIYKKVESLFRKIQRKIFWKIRFFLARLKYRKSFTSVKKVLSEL